MEFGGHFRALDLGEEIDSGYGQSDSEDSASDTKEPTGISIGSSADGDEGAGVETFKLLQDPRSP